MLVQVRDRFGWEGVTSPSAGTLLGFFELGREAGRVGHTLNPLVVGSIPTRPTKFFKHLASSSGGALCFLGSPQVGIAQGRSA